MKKKITVIGLGYVGLPTLLILSNLKKFVCYGYDNDKIKIENIKKRKIKVSEKEVNILLKNNIKNKNLIISNEINSSDVFIICVPSNANKKLRQNFTPLLNAIDKIINVLKKNDLIIIETTSEVGTTEMLQKYIYKRKKSLFNNSLYKPYFFMAYCPEKVFPGNTIHEIKNNPRIIGGINKPSNIRAKNFFINFSKKIFLTDSKTAEITKLVENSYRNVQIGFVNDLANYTEKRKLDILKIIQLSNLHPRINLLKPGIGVGGHCIPIDPYFLIQNKSQHFKLLQASIKTNERRPKIISDNLKKVIKKKKIKELNLFGLTYKPNIDDFRESPAISIFKNLLREKNLKINLIDPYIKKNQFNFNKRVKFYRVKNIKNDNDTLNILLVDHKEFSKYKNNKKVINLTN